MLTSTICLTLFWGLNSYIYILYHRLLSLLLQNYMFLYYFNSALNSKSITHNTYVTNFAEGHVAHGSVKYQHGSVKYQQTKVLFFQGTTCRLVVFIRNWNTNAFFFLLYFNFKQNSCYSSIPDCDPEKNINQTHKIHKCILTTVLNFEYEFKSRSN